MSRPVVLGSCVYGAWAGPAKVYYNVNCGKADPVPAASIAPQVTAVRDGVAFRVNRGLIVLNDQDSGSVWDLQTKVVKMDDWDALISAGNDVKMLEYLVDKGVDTHAYEDKAFRIALSDGQLETVKFFVNTVQTFA